MDDRPLEPLLVFPCELDLHAKIFADSPVRIIELFLQCFDNEGHQRLGVPRHVLEAMAVRFRAFMDTEVGSLESAFGGQVVRQRNQIRRESRDFAVLFDFFGEREKAKSRSRAEGRVGTPTEEADEATAVKHGMTPDNVRKIYKRGRSGA